MFAARSHYRSFASLSDPAVSRKMAPKAKADAQAKAKHVRRSRVLASSAHAKERRRALAEINKLARDLSLLGVAMWSSDDAAVDALIRIM